MTSRISVCMIVRDEEQSIPQALESIPQEYEKIIIDTGSTDRTVEACQEYGAQVFHTIWQDDFALARNTAIGYASGDYILMLDADEQCDAGLHQQVEQFCREYPDRAAAVQIHNRMDDGVRIHRMVRLFPNHPSFRYHGIVHEQLLFDGSTLEAIQSDIILAHDGYLNEVYRAKNKFDRYEKLYEQSLAKHPNDGYMLYQSAKLYFSQDLFEQAEAMIKKSMALQEEHRLYYPVMLVMYGYLLKNTGRSQDAEKLLLPYLELYRDFPDLPFLLGLLAMDTGQINRIATYFEQALAIGETSKYTSVAGVGSFKASYNLGVFYEISGNIAQAVRCYQAAALMDYGPSKERLKKIN